MSVSSGAISIEGNIAFFRLVALTRPDDEAANTVRSHSGCLAHHTFELASTEASVQEWSTAIQEQILADWADEARQQIGQGLDALGLDRRMTCTTPPWLSSLAPTGPKSLAARD